MIIYLWSIRSNFCFCFYIRYLHLLLIVVLLRHCRVYLEVQTPRYLCLEVLFSPTRLFGSPPSTVTPLGFSFGKQAPSWNYVSGESFCAYLFSFIWLLFMISIKSNFCFCFYLKQLAQQVATTTAGNIELNDCVWWRLVIKLCNLWQHWYFWL